PNHPCRQGIRSFMPRGVVFLTADPGLTARYGFIPVGLGLTATAGTYAAGFCLLARDWVHDTAGRVAVLAAIAAAGAASAVMAGPRLALASATASGPRVREAMRDGHLGHIATPASGHRLQAGVHWCADNGAFTGAYPGDDKYLAWLSARTAHVARCAFAAAPDVVADGAATLARSLPMLERIRALGYPAALVAQDGLEDLAVPWRDMDAMFIGGTTSWKLGPAAAGL